MGTEEIVASHLAQAAAEVRQHVARQLETWQAIPYWTMESEGRGGWSDNWGLPYKYGLLGVDRAWPHRLFVELSTGRLVVNNSAGVVEADDKLIIETYSKDKKNFDAAWQLHQRVEMATNGKDTSNKERNDAQREKLKDRYKVPPKWTAPAKPIKYTY